MCILPQPGPSEATHSSSFPPTGDGGADIAFLVLGSLTFIPGFWASRIAYYKWRGYDGYRYEDIPTQ